MVSGTRRRNLIPLVLSTLSLLLAGPAGALLPALLIGSTAAAAPSSPAPHRDAQAGADTTPALRPAAANSTSAAPESSAVRGSSATADSLAARPDSHAAGPKSLAAPGGAAPALDPLWERAREVAARGDSLVPGIADVRVEQVDSDGRVQTGKRTIARLYQGADGKVKQEILRTIRYGRDAADPDSSEGPDEREKKREFSTSLGRNPFHYGDGVQVAFQPTGERRAVDGRTCAGYSFTRRNGKETMRGIAWLEEPTGIPLEMSYRESPLPKHVKQMTTTIKYASDGPLGWRMQSMTIDAMGGFFFIKKRFRVTSTFDQYWRLHPAPEAPGNEHRPAEPPLVSERSSRADSSDSVAHWPEDAGVPPSDTTIASDTTGKGSRPPSTHALADTARIRTR